MINLVNNNCKNMFACRNSNHPDKKTGNIKQDITGAGFTQQGLYPGMNVQDVYMSHIADRRYIEEAEQFEKLCSGVDNAVLEQIAEQTGLMRHLEDNTTAFVSGKGIGIKSVDGKELFIDMPDLPYDMLLRMFRGIPASGSYFDLDYRNNILLEADEEYREMSSDALNREGPAGSNESATDSDIIVKADGSRVLVITMKIGGMETTMSLKL